MTTNRTGTGRGWMTAGLATRGRRLLSAAIAIVIGAAFLAASLLVVSTAQRGLEDAVAAGMGDADLVVSVDQGMLGTEQFDAVSGIDGVSGVDGEALVFSELGGDYFPGSSLPTGGSTLLEGRLPGAEGEIAINPAAVDAGHAVGDTLAVTGVAAEADSPVAQDLVVVGVLDPGDASPLSFGEGFFATDSTLRSVDAALSYRSVQLQLASGASEDAVHDALTTAVPDGVVQTGPEAAEARVTALTGGTAVFAGILLGFGAVALATAAIVIANTFTITLAQRAGELALLRCVGATKAQVRRLVLLEALVLGLLSSAVGVLVGVGAAWGLLGLARRSDLGVPTGDGLALTPLALLLPLAVGTVVTVLASLLPASRATRVSPLAALRPAGPVSERRRVGWVRLVAAGGFVAAGVAAMLYAASAHDVLMGIAGGLLSFVGVLLSAVVVVPAAVRVLGLGARLVGVPGRLAVDNAVRNPGRAAATSAALLVGVTLITMTTVGAATGERTALGEIDDAYAVDLVALAPVGTDDQDQVVPPHLTSDLAARMAAVDGVAATSLVPSAQLTLGEQIVPTRTIGLDAADGTVVRSADQLAALQPGTIGLSNSLQAIHGLDPGDSVEVSGAGGAEELTVVEIGLGYNLALAEPDLRRLGGEEVGEGALLIRAGEDADLGGLLSGLEEIGDPEMVTVEGSAVERAAITQVLDVLVLVTTALLGVAVVIAVVGIANTLSLSVVERHREHALLRGMGLTRGQMRLMLLVEGVLLAVVSALIGLALGLLYARLGVQTIVPDGTPVLLAVPWARVGIIVGVALLAGLLASVLPARRAARVSPAEGLATA